MTNIWSFQLWLRKQGRDLRARVEATLALVEMLTNSRTLGVSLSPRVLIELTRTLPGKIRSTSSGELFPKAEQRKLLLFRFQHDIELMVSYTIQ